MISLRDIEEKVKEKLNTSHIKAIDLRGGDHIQLIVVSPEFEGKLLIDQHKMIYEILENELKSNIIHALTLKTYSPESWDKNKNGFKIGVDHEI